MIWGGLGCLCPQMGKHENPINLHGCISVALKSGLIISLLISVLVLAGLPASAADDAYLKMLEGEAASVELDETGQLKQEEKILIPENSAFDWNGRQLNEDSLPKGLDIEQFETFLQKNFYGTYVFFKKLNSTDKNTVHYRYSQAEKPDLENVRQNVMSLLKQ